MGKACDIFLTLLLLTGYCLVVICIFSPYWKIRDVENRVRQDYVNHQGLWMKCTSLNTGNWECDDFNRWFLGLDIELQVGRGLGLLSFVLGIIAFVSLLCGICDCDTYENEESRACPRTSPRFKKIAKFIAGVGSLLAGVSIIAATGFYASKVLERYWLAVPYGSTSIKMVFGWALFVGWVGGAIMFIVGIVILFMACRMSSDDDYSGNYNYDTNRPPIAAHRNYGYQPEQPATIYNKEYV